MGYGERETQPGPPKPLPATVTEPLSAAPQVPFTYIDYESNGKLWPGIHQMFNAVERFQVVNSYGLFRRMTGVGGRPEVVLEGSYDKQTWTVSRLFVESQNRFS